MKTLTKKRPTPRVDPQRAELRRRAAQAGAALSQAQSALAHLPGCGTYFRRREMLAVAAQTLRHAGEELAWHSLIVGEVGATVGRRLIALSLQASELQRVYEAVEESFRFGLDLGDELGCAPRYAALCTDLEAAVSYAADWFARLESEGEA